MKLQILAIVLSLACAPQAWSDDGQLVEPKPDPFEAAVSNSCGCQIPVSQSKVASPALQAGSPMARQALRSASLSISSICSKPEDKEAFCSKVKGIVLADQAIRPHLTPLGVLTIPAGKRSPSRRLEREIRISLRMK